jgi:CheY-like chemotaxis protein
VLVVDDETAVRAALAAMLAHHGYRPVPARGAAGVAESLAAAAAAVVAAVVDRPAALDAVRAARPDMPCVLLSGDPAQYDPGALRARGASAVLPKPVTLARLGRVVAAVAAAASRG